MRPVGQGDPAIHAARRAPCCGSRPERREARRPHQRYPRTPKTWSAVLGSRLPVGSSASRTAGLFATARAIATRCCSPARQFAADDASRAAAKPHVVEQFGAASPLLPRGATGRRSSAAGRCSPPPRTPAGDGGTGRRSRWTSAASPCRAGSGSVGRRLSIDENLAGVRLLQKAGDVQQRRLARAGGARSAPPTGRDESSKSTPRRMCRGTARPGR